MSESVYASISAIQHLNSEILSTRLPIESISNDEAELISKTLTKIDLVVSTYREKENSAELALYNAEQALATAESQSISYDDEGNEVRSPVPYEFYHNVDVCRDDYEEMRRLHREVKSLKDRYYSATQSHINKQSNLIQGYSDSIIEADHALSDYCSLLKKAIAATGGSSIGEYSTGSYVDSAKNDGSNTHCPAWSVTSNGDMIFNSPVETGKRLEHQQGKVKKFQGTCGLCSCANIVLLSGGVASERNMVDYAKANKLCSVGIFKSYNGATSAEDRQKILSGFGIDTMLVPQVVTENNQRKCQIEEIANYVSNGHGVILSVHANSLYHGWTTGADLHAVTVTSVRKSKNGDIIGFYLCDSNNMPSAFYTAMQLENALTARYMNVTSNPIRNEYDYSTTGAI